MIVTPCNHPRIRHHLDLFKQILLLQHLANASWISFAVVGLSDNFTSFDIRVLTSAFLIHRKTIWGEVSNLALRIRSAIIVAKSVTETVYSCIHFRRLDIVLLPTHLACPIGLRFLFSFLMNLLENVIFSLFNSSKIAFFASVILNLCASASAACNICSICVRQV